MHMCISMLWTLKVLVVACYLRIILPFYQAAGNTCGVEFLNLEVQALRFEICFRL